MLLNKSVKQTLLVTSIMALLTACGGGGGSDSSPPSGKTFSGMAVDFYLEGATVRLDDCNNATFTNATDKDGKFKFNLPAGCTASALTITGGTDTVTKKAFTGTLKVKSHSLENATAVASPLTTLQAILPAADFEKVLINLGFTANTDVNSFDPVAQGTAQQLATVFLIQQLLTQIEDALETSGATSDAATAIAAQALGNVLKDESLLTGGSYNTSLFNEIVTEAQTLVPSSFSINTASIASNISAISTAISDVGLNGNASALVSALRDPANAESLNNIQNSIPAAPTVPTASEFTTLEVGNYSLADLRNSSTGSPILLEKSEFSDIPTIKLTLVRPNVNIPETAMIGLKVTAGNESLDLVLTSVQVYFNGLGQPTRAVLPKDASVKVQSTVATLGKYENFSLIANENIELAVNNGVIDLASFSDKSDSLQSAFNKYYEKVLNAGTAKTETYVKLKTYNASPSLGLTQVPSAVILNTTFTNAYTAVGYFRFQP